MNNEYKNKILKILKHNPRISEKSFKIHFNELYQQVLKETQFLMQYDGNRSFSEKIFCVLNDITFLPLCETCNVKHVKLVMKNGKHYYSNVCSGECSNKNQTNINNRKKSIHEHWKDQAKKEKSLDKVKKSCQEKYGVNWPTQSDVVKQKTINTCIEKYGETTIFKNEQFKEQAKQTKQQHYGENWANVIGQKTAETLKNKSTEEKIKIQKKTKQTKIKRYGNENYVNVEKIKQTKLAKYGNANFNNTEKAKQTLQNHYENDPNFKEKIIEKTLKTREEHKRIDSEYQQKINEKVRKTCLERYGVDKACKTPNAIAAAKIRSGKISYERFILNSKFDQPLFSLDEYLNRINPQQKLKFKCNLCGNVFETHHDNGFHSRCPKCFPIKSISHQEKELVDFVKSILTIKFEENNRKIITPYELDIYVPDRKIAIEFDGIHWHNSENRPHNYHLNKTELCEKQGIQLIHIFENEWNTKQNIIKSRIKNLFGIYNKTIFARKCVIKEVESKISKQFQEDNHIQGEVNAKIHLGLYFENELVSLMTFGKCRFDKKHEWELLRFCNKLGYHVPGGASKLLKHFERNYKPKSIVTYADRRWSQGKLYEALGFKLDHISKPDYWYFNDRYNLQSRIKYQKHKLKNILEKFDETKSEIENMKNNGFERIFDCGNLVYEKVYS